MKRFVICLFFLGCGAEDVTVQDICTRWENCREWDYGPSIADECPFRFMVLSKECLEELNGVVCSKKGPEEAEYAADLCWPECSPSVVYCRGDYFVECDGREWVTDCVSLCGSKGSSGTCGEGGPAVVECVCE
jgi:hypothetical protein